MESNEFRKGIIIKTKSGHLPYWCITDEDMIHIFSNIENGNIDNYEPILLTKERLLESGFKKNSVINEDQYEKEDLKIVIGIRTCLFTYCIDGEVEIDIEPIMYLHQLQNVWVDLKGKELQQTNFN